MENQKIGALWKKTSKEGMTFYSGQIDTMFGKVRIAVFKNNKKEKDNHPDLNIVFSGREDYSSDHSKTTSSDDPFADDGRASPADDPFGDGKPPVEPKGADLDTIQL